MNAPRPLSAVIITLNAERLLPRVIAPLRTVCAEVLVVDSGSSDGTVALAQSLGARVVHQDFLGYGPQKRRAVELAAHNWVLNVDADEVVDDALAAGIAALPLGEAGPRCWRVRRRNFVGGREIRHGAWNPDLPLRLFDRRATTFTDAPVHESVPPAGAAPLLPGSLLHYSYPDHAAIFKPNLLRLKAESYRRRGRRAGAALLLLRGAWAFVHSYLLRCGLLDGAAGVVVALSCAVNAVLPLAQASDEVAAKEP